MSEKLGANGFRVEIVVLRPRGVFYTSEGENGDRIKNYKNEEKRRFFDLNIIKAVKSTKSGTVLNNATLFLFVYA